MTAPLGSTSPRSPHAGPRRKPLAPRGGGAGSGGGARPRPLRVPRRGAGRCWTRRPRPPRPEGLRAPGAEGCGHPAPDRTNDEQRVRLGNGQKRAFHGATAGRQRGSARAAARAQRAVTARATQRRRSQPAAPRAAPPPAARPAPDIRSGPYSRLGAVWRCARRRAAAFPWPGRGCCSSETPSPRYRRSVLTWRVTRAPTAAPCPAESGEPGAAQRPPVLPSAPRLARPPPCTRLTRTGCPED